MQLAAACILRGYLSEADGNNGTAQYCSGRMRLSDKANNWIRESRISPIELRNFAQHYTRLDHRLKGGCDLHPSADCETQIRRSSFDDIDQLIDSARRSYAYHGEEFENYTAFPNTLLAVEVANFLGYCAGLSLTCGSLSREHSAILAHLLPQYSDDERASPTEIRVEEWFSSKGSGSKTSIPLLLALVEFYIYVFTSLGTPPTMSANTLLATSYRSVDFVKLRIERKMRYLGRPIIFDLNSTPISNREALIRMTPKLL